MLTLKGRDLPDKLHHIADPPEALFVLGEDIRTLVAQPSIAIVGTRAVTAYGRFVTQEITEALARIGVVIVSGLALGTDGIAHEAALRAGGKTIAVVAGGIERIYPRSHELLARRIYSGHGSVVSEHGGTFSPRKHDFLIRNRLVAALADGIIITEAAERSGTLNTVVHALNQGKTVFAVPGNITSPMSAGTNQMLKSGAIPVTTVRDVLDGMNWRQVSSVKPKKVHYNGSAEEMKVLSLIEAGVSSGEELAHRSKLPSESCNFALTMLELHGIIRSAGNNTWQLINAAAIDT